MIPETVKDVLREQRADVFPGRDEVVKEAARELIQVAKDLGLIDDAPLGLGETDYEPEKWWACNVESPDFIPGAPDATLGRFTSEDGAVAAQKYAVAIGMTALGPVYSQTVSEAFDYARKSGCKWIGLLERLSVVTRYPV